MTFGERLVMVRKRRKMSQADVGKIININGDAYGRYERDEMKPSIDTATKLADLLEVSLDYLVGKTDIELDTTTLNRVLEVQKLPKDVRDKLFYFIDMSIRDYKAKKAYS